ncbi:hypothetical protein Aduo_015397 [Ancylostoma duodenale]
MVGPIIYGSWAEEVSMNPPDSIESIVSATKSVKKKCKPCKVTAVKKPTESSISDKNKEKEELAAKPPFSNWVEFKKNKRLKQKRREEELIRDLNGLEVSTTKKANQGCIVRHPGTMMPPPRSRNPSA